MKNEKTEVQETSLRTVKLVLKEARGLLKSDSWSQRNDQHDGLVPEFKRERS